MVYYFREQYIVNSLYCGLHENIPYRLIPLTMPVALCEEMAELLNDGT